MRKLTWKGEENYLGKVQKVLLEEGQKNSNRRGAEKFESKGCRKIQFEGGLKNSIRRGAEKFNSKEGWKIHLEVGQTNSLRRWAEKFTWKVSRKFTWKGSGKFTWKGDKQIYLEEGRKLPGRGAEKLGNGETSRVGLVQPPSVAK